MDTSPRSHSPHRPSPTGRRHTTRTRPRQHASSGRSSSSYRRADPGPALPGPALPGGPRTYPASRSPSLAAERSAAYLSADEPSHVTSLPRDDEEPTWSGTWPWHELPHPADDPTCAPPALDRLATLADLTPPTDPPPTPQGTATTAATNPPTCTAPSELAQLVSHAAELLAQLANAALTTPVGAGDIDVLLQLLAAADRGQAAVAVLTARLQGDRLVHRHTGLGFLSLLDAQSLLPSSEHRRLLRTAEVLRDMPCLSAAIATGTVPAASLPALVGELRRLNQTERRLADNGFGPSGRLSGLDGDAVADAIRQLVSRLRPALAQDDERRATHDRMLAVTPREDGRLTGYFELDPEAGATLLAALDQASPPPASGPEDTAKHALDAAPHLRTPESWPRRARNRQRADGLLRLCEQYLAHPGPRSAGDRAIHNPHPDGTGGTIAEHRQPGGAVVHNPHPDGTGGEAHATRCQHRAKPRLLVMTDIATLTGDDEHAQAARLLWATASGPIRLTPETVRRLASDATLRFILHDRGQILGSTAPTATITAALRDAVTARDQQCRFPGCQAPVAWCDLHHVVPRHQGGPTTPENLVALCRRHHTAVTNGAWQLSMSPAGTVTVRRGHRSATSRPPQQQPPPAV